MKKILTILLMSLMLVACENEGQTYVEEEVEFIGNTLIESKRDEDVAIFKRKNGEVLSLKWEYEPHKLTEGAIYKVQYQTNVKYTTYMEISNYDKVD